MATTKVQPSVAECQRILTGPGQPLEIENIVVNGRHVPAFKNLPPTYRDFFMTKAAQFSDRILFSAPPLAGTTEREYVTYAETLDRAVALAAWLRTQGIGQGDMVGIGGYNAVSWVIAFIATHLVGGVPVLLNASLNADSLIHCLKLTTPKLTLLDNAVSASLAGTYNDKLKPFCVGPLYSWTRKAYPQIQPLPQFTPTTAQTDDILRGDFLDLGPDHDAHVFFTSGTTGYPKAVLSTQRMGLTNHYSTQISGAVALMRKGLPPPPQPSVSIPQKVHLLAVPLFHVTGTLSWLMRAMNNGIKLVFMDRWSVPAAVDLIITERVNLVGGVPAIATQLAQSKLLPPDIPFDGVAYGGAPAPARLATDVKARWPTATVAQGYGATETNALACGVAGDDYLAKPDSTGPAVPCCRVRIVDPETKRELPTGVPGIIELAGVQIMKEYLNDPKATAAALDADGWLDTGDVGYLDDDKFLYISDRAKDMIIRGGENVPSAEVENALLRDPRLSQVIAVPVPDDVMGEVVGVLYTVRPEHEASPESVTAAVNRHLRKAARPDIAVQYHEPHLPTNANGKFVKKDLKHHVLDAWKKREAKLKAKL